MGALKQTLWRRPVYQMYPALALGWILFGLATLRAAVFPRWAALLIVAGATIAFLPLPSRTLVLAIAVGLLGVRLLRGTATTVEPARDRPHPC